MPENTEEEIAVTVDEESASQTNTSDISVEKKLSEGTSEPSEIKENLTIPAINNGLSRPINPEELPDAVASATVAVPPDGGWGWVVVAASFVCNFLVDGIIFSYGVFLTDIAEYFHESKAKVAIAGSLLSGFYLIGGPFVSGLANRYGFRIVTIAGAIISCAAFGLSTLSSSIEVLYVTLGILGGIGFGMIYAPSVIIVGYYFERWRALATGVAVCGSGIGTFLLAPFCQTLLDTLDWRQVFLILGGFMLLNVICGLLFRPLKPVMVLIEKEPELDLLRKIKLARDVDMRDSVSVASLRDTMVEINQLTRTSRNSDYPTAAEVLIFDTETSKLSKSSISLDKKNLNLDENKRFSVPIFNQNDGIKSEVTKRDSSVTKRIRTSSECSSGIRSRRGTVTECVIGSRRGTIVQLEGGVNRPLYRDDIFFASSLNRLHKYQPEKDLMAYTMSVTHLPTKTDEAEEKECRVCPEAVRRAVATMLDMSLLKSPTFILLCTSGFLTLMGFYTPFMYLTDRAKLGGMEPGVAKWLIACIGVTNTIGRVLCGAVSSAPGVDALTINNVALTVGGIATMFSGLSMSTAYTFTYSAVFGFAIACFASLRSIILVDLLGLEKLTNAFGLLLLFQGIAAVIGAPIAGLFMEYTGSYDASFYLSGTLILISGIVCYPLNAINRWEKKRNEKIDKEIEKKPAVV